LRDLTCYARARPCLGARGREFASPPTPTNKPIVFACWNRVSQIAPEWGIRASSFLFKKKRLLQTGSWTAIALAMDRSTSLRETPTSHMRRCNDIAAAAMIGISLSCALACLQNVAAACGGYETPRKKRIVCDILRRERFLETRELAQVLKALGVRLPLYRY